MLLPFSVLLLLGHYVAAEFLSTPDLSEISQPYPPSLSSPLTPTTDIQLHSTDPIGTPSSSLCLVCAPPPFSIFSTLETSPTISSSLTSTSHAPPKAYEESEHNTNTIRPSATTTEDDTTSTITKSTSSAADPVFEVDDSQIEIDIPVIEIEQEPVNQTVRETKSNNSNSTLDDDCHFMSFEEWKKQKADSDTTNKETNSSVGENTEQDDNSSASAEITSDLALRTHNLTRIDERKTSKEAEDQGKVYKDKFNYASVDCAATVVKTNSEASGAGSILVENKDSYLLNQCSSPNKFVIIELCQDILVDSVIIGNFEFFSSMFHEVRVSVSDRFPATTWKILGEFEAENIRDIQIFKIQNPLIWARYLKLEILSHYGTEFYCPISLVRVHGKTMMEEFKEGENEEQPTEKPSAVESQVASDLILDLENLNDSDSGIDNESLYECRVTLPHLVLTEFLKDINSTTEEYCEATYEPETSHTIEIQTTQESIYKNIMKRLSLLESNASLSLLYIEEQSKLLSNAFTNLERRQSNSFETLIESFNTTIVNQLLNFKKTYINMHNEYAKLFKVQESNHKDLLNDSKKKVSVLGNDYTFQKRLSIFNSIILICLLVYVVLTRDAQIDEILDSSSKKRKHRKNYPAGLVNRRQKRKERRVITNRIT